MRKYFLWTIVALIITTFTLTGCKGKGFDSVPYNISAKTSEEISTIYSEAKVGTYQLTANYETNVTNFYPQEKLTETKTIKTTVGDLNNNYFCRTETITYHNGETIGSETIILYGGYKYVSTYDVASGLTTKTKQVYTGLYPKQETLNNLYVILQSDSIETVYEKTYEKEQYYRTAQYLRSVNFDASIQKPEDTYFSDYEYEFGISKSGYVHVFNTYNTLIIGEYQDSSTWKTYRTQTIKTTLKEYGTNLYIEIPDDLNTYEEI